ncbi:MAG TPA: response regulator [Coleofasciculaceae cyanobacterium]
MKKILIIEDDDLLRARLFQLLKAEHFEVIATNQGLTGVKFATELEPDLILSDVELPYLQGYEVLKTLRQNAKTAKIPFIFISSERKSESCDLVLYTEAVDYLIKPVSDQAVLNAIATYLPNDQSHDDNNNHSYDFLAFNKNLNQYSISEKPFFDFPSKDFLLKINSIFYLESIGRISPEVAYKQIKAIFEESESLLSSSPS